MRAYNRQFDAARVPEYEPGGGEMFVEVDQVYETTEHLIGRMLEAGRRLEEARAHGFDFEDGVDAGPSEGELLRAPGADLADVSRLRVELEQRLTAAVEKAAKARAETEKAEAQKAVEAAAAALVAEQVKSAEAARKGQ